MNPRFHRLLLALLAACFGAAAVRASVVQADLKALTQATSALVALNSAGDLQRSTNGGASFTTTRTATADALSNVIAAGDTVVAVGNAGFVVRSTNGGQTWTNATTPSFPGGGILQDAAANGTFWVAVGRIGLNVTALWSQNGGETWTSGTMPATAGTLRGVAHDASTGRWTAVGGDAFGTPLIFTSTDGKTWTAVAASLGASALNDVVSDGQGRVLAVGEWGTLLVSTNGGQTFTADPDSGLVSEALNVVVYSSSAGFVAGGEDLVQLTYTSGAGATITQAPVASAGNIVAIALDANGAPIIAGSLSGYQTITFAGPGDQSLAAGSVTLSATASSGLPVTFQLMGGPATLDGNVLTFTGAGFVTIRATQAGGSGFDPAPPVERTFEITASTTASFETWRAANFTSAELADANVSGAAAIASADGLPNLLKYALGLSAKTPAAGAAGEAGTTGTHYTLTFTRAAALPDVTCTVEASTDLATWTETGVTLEQVSADTTSETWRASYPTTGTAAVFFRLKVTRNVAQ